MKMAKLVLSILSCFLKATLAKVSGPGIQCFVPGECLDSQILDARPTNSSRACLNLCQSITGCEWFTWYTDSQICTSLSGCLSLTQDKCGSNCVSGEQECPEVQCGVQGRCYGALEGIRLVGSDKECGSLCGNRAECAWFSYSNQTNSCTMTNDCPALDRSCDDCIASEKACEETGPDQEKMEDLVFFWKKNFGILNTNTKEIIYKEFPTPFDVNSDLVTISKYDGKLIILEYLSDRFTGYSMDKQTKQWNKGPNQSCQLNLLKRIPAAQLIDGRIWFFCAKDVALIFDGKSFIPSGLLPWSGPGIEILEQGLALVNGNQVLIAGGIETKTLTTSKKVYVMDIKEQESKTSVPDLPRGLMNPDIWRVVLNGKVKVIFARGQETYHGSLNEQVDILDWKSMEYTSLEKNELYVPPLHPHPYDATYVSLVFYSGTDAYFMNHYYFSHDFFNLQHYASTQDPKPEFSTYGENEISTIRIPRFLNLREWIEGPNATIFVSQASRFNHGNIFRPT